MRVHPIEMDADMRELCALLSGCIRNVKRGEWISRATFEGKDATEYRVMEYFNFDQDKPKNGRTLCRWINKKEEKELTKARK